MKSVADLLRQSGLATLEARALLAWVLRVQREALAAHPEQVVDDQKIDAFDQLVARRKSGEPLAYLLGAREFFGRIFRVTPDVLIPRPETELLVEQVLASAEKTPRPRILELGTGSGCIAITLAIERPDAAVVAVDRSEQALNIARDNAARLGASVAFLRSDWYASVSGRFDFIVANPPYVAEGDPHLVALGHEPQEALVAPDQGLAALRVVVGEARKHLTSNGRLFVEHGYDQAVAVRSLFIGGGFSGIASFRDAAGIERVTTGTAAVGGANRDAAHIA